MKIITTITFYLFTFLVLNAQITADFENFGLNVGEVLDQDMTGAGFATGSVSLPNNYNENYGSWSGWAISATTDTITPGFTNQFSSITGSGYDGSTAYGVAFEFGTNTIEIVSTINSSQAEVSGMYISNSTYTYYSMLEGDAFAKKFGGETGEDPDFLSVVFRGEVDGVATADSVEFFLADYRSDNSTEDYILKDWTWVDLSSLGFVDRVTFSMRSSDVGAYGINTPLYFCVDNIIVVEDPLSVEDLQTLDIDIAPNPTSNMLNINLASLDEAHVKVFSLLGVQLAESTFFGGSTSLNLSDLPYGHYIIQIQQGGAIGSTKIVKI